MTSTKYGKYIMTEQGGSKMVPGTGMKQVVLEGPEDWGGIQHRMNWQFVMQPGVILKSRGSHDFDEFLVFVSSNPADELDFNAEIEIMLGDPGEKQVITAPTIVCIPDGLVHGPVTCMKLEKPILFSQIYLAPEYKLNPV